MPIQGISELAGRTFRTGQIYELVLFDRLALEEQAALAELRGDPDMYGVLRPRSGSGHTFRAVGRDTALLLLTLREPGPLPFFVWTDNAEAAASAVTELVLDGVLEIEEAGQFVSGAAAAALFVARGTNVGGRLSSISLEAVRYGEALRLDDQDELAARLYGFGRIPVTPELAGRFVDDESLLGFLGAPAGSDLRRRLTADWRQPDQPDATGWLLWTRPGRQARRADAPTYKLYVSPGLEDLPRVFGVVVDCLGRRDGANFKIARQADGLARPDKLVAYFDSLDLLVEAADELAGALPGVTPHGVPFSAEIALEGTLSWGMDPPVADRTLTWQAPESWRLWVVRRLAAAMVAAQASHEPSMSPAEFALERMRLSGVDVDSWTPSQSLWSAA